MKHPFHGVAGYVLQQGGAGHPHQKDQQGILGHRQGEQQDGHGAEPIDGKQRSVQESPVYPSGVHG